MISSITLILECPHCSKRYHLDESRLPYAPVMGHSRRGVELICSDCQERWWQFEDSASYRPFVDLTELSVLRRSSSHSIPNKVRREGTRSKKPSQTMRYLGLVGILGVGIGWVTYFENDFWSVSSLKNFLGLFRFSEPIRELIVQDVKYNVQTFQNQKKVIIVGEVINPNQESVPVPKLVLKLRGHHTPLANVAPDSKLSSPPTQILKKSSYQWVQSRILPKEHVLFEAVIMLPISNQVMQAEVELE
jgi:hypothetical protein